MLQQRHYLVTVANVVFNKDDLVIIKFFGLQNMYILLRELLLNVSQTLVMIYS